MATPQHLIDEIRARLPTQSRRSIARELPVSRETVRRVAMGILTQGADLPEPARCPGCGHKTETPCRICAARRRLKAALKIPRRRLNGGYQTKAQRAEAAAEARQRKLNDYDPLRVAVRGKERQRYLPLFLRKKQEEIQRCFEPDPDEAEPPLPDALSGDPQQE